MSDFHQQGLISTLPRLQSRSLENLESLLESLVQTQPVALVLPCTLADFQGSAMQDILRQLRDARYFSQIVVSINQANASEIGDVRHSLKIHDDSRMVLIWNDDPELLASLPQAASGKGFNFWTAVGYLHQKKQCRVVVTHDTDILNYTRELPALLTLPLVDPNLGYQFVKGYYPRLSKDPGQLFGRVTRLFMGPLLRALIRVEGHQPLLDFLDSFRYPLSGEFGARIEILSQSRMSSGWDLEMDLLCSVNRMLAPESVAQIDLGFNYEHKHQILVPGQPHTGLTRLASESYFCLLRNLDSEGVRVTPEFQSVLQSAYRKSARETIRRYRHVALLNQLDFHEENEMAMVEEFSQVLTLPPNTAPSSLPAWSELEQSSPMLSHQFFGNSDVF